MYKTLLCTIMGSIAFSGCVSNKARKGYTKAEQESDSRYYWGQATILNNNSTQYVSAEECCKVANDTLKRPDVRAFAAAYTLAAYVHPAATAGDMKKAIPDGKWLNACSLLWMDASGGFGPFLVHDGTPFHLKLFPDATNYSTWNIWFTLSTPSGEQLTNEEARSFLEGKSSSKLIKLTEFVIRFPVPDYHLASIDERHSARGIGIALSPPTWFDFE